MLSIARLGLLQRGLGEEKFLEPLENRLCEFSCPADQAIQFFQNGGIQTLISKWKLD